MPKKGKFMRLSEDVIASLQKYQTLFKVKTEDDALRLIFQRLQYLEDLALQQHQTGNQTDSENPLQFIQDHPCNYRAIRKTKEGFEIFCDDKKIPLEVCIQRQKRYLYNNRICIPKALALARKRLQKLKQPQKTRIYRDEFEQAYYPDSEDYYRDDWGQI